MHAATIHRFNFNKLTADCDKRLHRLISYMLHTKDWTQVCWVGDDIKDCKLVLFVDASFAADLTEKTFTSHAK